MIREQRRLAAIVSADVAGYSRLMSPPGPTRTSRHVRFYAALGVRADVTRTSRN